MSDSSCEHLILLVGSNPLPNYIVAKMLQPKTVWLLYTEATKDVKSRLETALCDDIPSVQIEGRFLESATDAQEVRRVCADLPHNSHLNYTGGTKVMAAHARLAFAEQREGDASAPSHNDALASYVDEVAGLLRFDDGTFDALTDSRVGLTLSRLLQLHDVTQRQASSHMLGPTEADAEALAHYVLQRPDTAAELYQRYCDEPETKRPLTSAGLSAGTQPQSNQQKPRKAKKGWERLRDDRFVPPAGLTLSRERIPNGNMLKEPIEKWQKFLTGGWLEMWLGSAVQEYGGNVSVSVNCFKDGRQFEVDVAVIRNCRLYLNSCTTDMTMDRCKSKLFEVAMRGRHMGGDLARTSLVCLRSCVDQLRADVGSVWDASNTPIVFGLDDLKAWAGLGQEQNRSTLKAWLNR